MEGEGIVLALENPWKLSSLPFIACRSEPSVHFMAGKNLTDGGQSNSLANLPVLSVESTYSARRLIVLSSLIPNNAGAECRITFNLPAGLSHNIPPEWGLQSRGLLVYVVSQRTLYLGATWPASVVAAEKRVLLRCTRGVPKRYQQGEGGAENSFMELTWSLVA